MNSKFIDLTGKRFGHLEVISLAQNGKTRRSWLVKCDCGNSKVMGESRLFPIKGRKPNKSCGCAQFKQDGESIKNPRIFNVWRLMIRRCTDKTVVNYERYGGVGVTVCDEWENDFKQFLEWSLDNGYDSKLTLDRINPSEPYQPSNCRWANYYAQAQNRGVFKNNTSGVIGVTGNKQNNMFRAAITRDGVTKYLGRFTSLEDAKQARERAEEYYTEHGTLENL